MNSRSKTRHFNPELVRILMIEDNPGDARFVEDILSEAGTNRFRLEHVSQVSEGLTRLTQERYHVILLGLSLLNGDGLDTVRQVCFGSPHLPVIILTALKDETVATQALQEGAQDYLVKGQMDSNLLARAIRYAIERKRAEERLRESEERFRQLAENIREVFYIYEQDITQLLYVSPAYEEIWGRPCKNLHRDPGFLLDNIHPADKDRVINASAKRSREEVEELYRIVRPDGSIRWIKDRSFPIYDKSGKTYRIVGIAADITDLKLGEEQLKYLSLHDPLTGLYNRVYFEEEMSRVEKMRCDAVGIITCDLDGLKLVNDTLGHDSGDAMLKLAATVMKECFRGGDAVARIGGDEFSVILPDTSPPAVQGASQRILEAVERYNASNPELPLSISVGYAVKNGVPFGMRELFKEADNDMYRKKLYRNQTVRSTIVRTLMRTLRARDFITEGHADRLEKLLTNAAALLGLPEATVTDLRLLAQFHDVGKIGIPDSILLKNGPLTSEEWCEMHRHCEIGYRIALSAPDFIPIADWILKHHEWWDGHGYPLALKGGEIPVECRILAIADAYEALTSVRPFRRAFSHAEAVATLQSRSGTQFDPDILDKFVRMLESHPPES